MPDNVRKEPAMRVTGCKENDREAALNKDSEAGRLERYDRKNSRMIRARRSAYPIFSLTVLRRSGRLTQSSPSPGSSTGRTSSCKEESIEAFIMYLQVVAQKK
jgi:hypothetical protein